MGFSIISCHLDPPANGHKSKDSLDDCFYLRHWGNVIGILPKTSSTETTWATSIDPPANSVQPK